MVPVSRAGFPRMKHINRLKITQIFRTVRRAVAAVLFISLLITSCKPNSSWQPAPAWTYSDLRAILPVNGKNPHHEITAVYARFVDDMFQFRMDLLESPEEVDYDLYIVIDAVPGGGGPLPVAIETQLNWDFFIQINASGRIIAVDKNADNLTGLNLLVTRDTRLDMTVVSMDRNALGKPKGSLLFQVFILPSGENAPISNTGILSSDGWKGSSPPRRVDVQLVFWDTFPAASPSQALRRWNGAHTGPDSDRHGLSGLLRALATTSTPAVLLDLKTPSSLSALDYVGGLSMVQDMVRDRLLVIPDAAPIASDWSQSLGQPPEWALLRSIEESKSSGIEYGFNPSPYLYYPSNQPLPQNGIPASLYKFIFNQDVSISSPWQAGVERPSMHVRLSLLERALDPGNNSLGPLILGGSLAESTWGNYQSAYQTLSYLKSRPWINFITADQHTIKMSRHKVVHNAGERIMLEYKGRLTGILGDLYQAPVGVPTQLAWQFYRDLLMPPSPVHQNLAELRRGYLGYIGLLLEAALWAEDPSSYPQDTHCESDLDWDGKPDCILASEDIFLVLKPEGGYAALGFAHQGPEIYQILGSSAQFLVGASDPTLWDPELGLAGDPNQYRGAFSEIPTGYTKPSWETYTTETGSGWLTFRHPAGNLTKTFRLIKGGMEVEYRTENQQQIQVPLVLDPGSRFFPGWRDKYQYKKGESGFTWYLQGGPRLELFSDRNINVKAFVDSREEVFLPENPNYEYPPGHFLPFPMLLAELTAGGEFSIKLVFTDQ
jgi:hypothetical protein